MISSQNETEFQPWANFWQSKQSVNAKLLKAVKDGMKDQVSRLLNPLEPVDKQPEVRYTNSEGYGAVHLAVLNGHKDILKILLETDKTLLCMETENEDM